MLTRKQTEGLNKTERIQKLWHKLTELKVLRSQMKIMLSTVDGYAKRGLQSDIDCLSLDIEKLSDQYNKLVV